MHIPYCIRLTLRIQPAVLLFCSVSILAKVASGFLPKRELGVGLCPYILGMIYEWRLLVVICLMLCALALYAFIWQRLIKNARIAIIYANKSSGILWSQLAAVVIFGERLGWGDILGICVIFTGIMLANSSAWEK